MPNCGIIDVGSNTIRLSIYHYDRKGFRLLLGKKETAGLAGYVQDGALSPQGMERAAQVLSSFRFLLENLGIQDYYAFATASLRNVSNTQQAAEAIQRASGVSLTVISGAEEAALSFQGALLDAPSRPGKGLLVDIGGGSTELVVYEDGAVSSGVSLPIGSLSLFTQHVSGLLPTDQEWKEIRRHVRQALEQAEAVHCPHLRGVGGTIRAAGKLCGLKPGDTLPAGEVRDLYHRLRDGDREALRRVLQVSPDRIHTLLPGLAILNAILKRFQVETLDVSTQGVREGYLLTYVMGEGEAGAQGR